MDHLFTYVGCSHSLPILPFPKTSHHSKVPTGIHRTSCWESGRTEAPIHGMLALQQKAQWTCWMDLKLLPPSPWKSIQQNCCFHLGQRCRFFYCEHSPIQSKMFQAKTKLTQEKKDWSSHNALNRPSWFGLAELSSLRPAGLWWIALAWVSNCSCSMQKQSRPIPAFPKREAGSEHTQECDWTLGRLGWQEVNPDREIDRWSSHELNISS